MVFEHRITGVVSWWVEDLLRSPDEIRRTIKYVEDNPLPYRMPRQSWEFVTKYDNWPLHEGHNMNSPYVKRLIAAGRYPRDRKC